jgi:guanosine-3',5'-bis(diphosphate) 3'-pyrophosphohydrolase
MSSNNNSSLGLIIKALAFAADKHRNQRRKNAEASPYINHPIALADVLANEGGITDAAVICAALLHDTIEDTETTVAELQANFGVVIAGYVLEVTDDKSLPKAQRKQLQIDGAQSLSMAAKLVKLADKICNVRDMVGHAPQGWDVVRKREYFDWAKRVVDGLSAADGHSSVNEHLKAAFDAAYAHRPD